MTRTLFSLSNLSLWFTWIVLSHVVLVSMVKDCSMSVRGEVWEPRLLHICSRTSAWMIVLSFLIHGLTTLYMFSMALSLCGQSLPIAMQCSTRHVLGILLFSICSALFHNLHEHSLLRFPVLHTPLQHELKRRFPRILLHAFTTAFIFLAAFSLLPSNLIDNFPVLTLFVRYDAFMLS